MKSLKLIALILMVAITGIGYAQTEIPAEQTPDPDPQSVVIQLKTAMQNPGLVKAMHVQLNPRFLSTERPLYTARVNYQRKAFYISGTYNQWKDFFRIDTGGDPLDSFAPEIPLRTAMKNQQLVRAMRAQLDARFLQQEKQIYSVPVRYRHTVIKVVGTLNDWRWFFRIKKINDTHG